ncbi:hypothetical protein Ancab_028017 [Ancistrocladus abbreviatus]
MADSTARLKDKSTKKRKPKVRSLEHEARRVKARSKYSSEEEREETEDATTVGVTESAVEEERKGTMRIEDEGRQWRNLNLILAIQNKELEVEKKVELLLDYVKSRAVKENDDEDRILQTVNVSRLIVYVSNWVQTLLISSEKKIRVAMKDSISGASGSCLDYRCWEIFRFCLKESLRLNFSLRLSRDLLRVIRCIARSALDLLEIVPLKLEHSKCDDKAFALYSIVCNCMNLIFSSHGGMSNGNLDLWIDAVDSVLDAVIKIYSDDLGVCAAGNLVIQLACLVLEPFSKFLRVHPCRKNGFRDFVDKLLQPLLNLLFYMHDNSSPVCIEELSKLVKEVLSHALFHPVQIDEFLSLHSTDKYSSSIDGQLKEPKTMIKSYHRHLFDKLENIIYQKKALAIGGIGELFWLFVDCVKKHKTDSKRGESSKLAENKSINHTAKDLSRTNALDVEKGDYLTSIYPETRKSIFGFFVQTTELLLLDMQTQQQCELQVRISSRNVFCALKSTNKMLSTMLDEKLYTRTEDTDGEACLNFFKVIYSVIMLYSEKINELWISTGGCNDVAQVDILVSTTKELVVAVRYFLEIEYEVIADDMVSIWIVIISFLAMRHSLKETPELCSLTSGAVDLACRLVSLYAELRQVSQAVFALCSGLRHLSLPQSVDKVKYLGFLSSTSSVPCDTFVKSARLLVCSQKFRLAIHDAIKTIPEGQASVCIQMLTEDISESLEWMKVGCSVAAEDISQKMDYCRLRIQAELLGVVLAEIYTQVLDSLSVTAGNSNLIGVSTKNLMMMLHPYMSTIVTLQQDGHHQFVFSVTGRTPEGESRKCKNDLKDMCHWFFSLFFRLYVSCRSLFRQALSFMPPVSSKKMSAVFGDLLTAYSGCDWLERTDLTDDGYFAWILRPSASLLAVIQSVFQKSSAVYPSLTYVMHVMAFQRLIDLNRQIKSFDYLIQRNDNVIQSKLMDDSGLSFLRKNTRKWQKILSVLRQEAVSLTDFALENLSLVDDRLLHISSVNEETANDAFIENHEESDSWDLNISAVNEKTFPTAFWWITCRNLDVWCAHASKDKLKMFLSLLIRSSLPYQQYHMADRGKNTNIGNGDKKVTLHQISLELLYDTIFYEQRFVCRYLASSFCRVLEKSISPLFQELKNADAKLNLSPDWEEVLSALENSSMAAGGEELTCDCSSTAELISFAYNGHSEQCHEEQTSFSWRNLHILACMSLLNLLCHIPKRSMSFRSFSVYVTSLLSFERIIVGSLLDSSCALCTHKQCELLRLLVSCRRALKYLILEFCEEKMKASDYSLLPVFSQSPSPILWFLKSVNVAVRGQNILSNDQVNDMVFSLVDHTSYVLLTLCKYQFDLAVRFLAETKKSGEEQLLCGHGSDDESGPTKFCCCMKSSSGINACKSLICIAKSLKDQLRSLVFSLDDALVDLNKLSSLMSCICGFLWGLASELGYIDERDCNLLTKLVRDKNELMSTINGCLNSFSEVLDSVSHMLLIDSSQQHGSQSDAEGLLESDNGDDSHEVPLSLKQGSDDEKDSEHEEQHLSSDAGKVSLLLSGIDNDSNSSTDMKALQSENVRPFTNVLGEVDSFSQDFLRKNLLKEILSGKNPGAAFLLRELFIASSAILRINTQINCTPLSSSWIRILFGSSQLLLMEFGEKVEVPKSLSFIWLDGALKFLEELGTQFSQTNLTTTRDVYAKLVYLHLRGIGKCIALQGKRATLASHDAESSTKTINSQIEVSESSASDTLHGLEELKSRLRISFKVLIKRSSELHLLSALQAIERALVGVREGYTMIYELTTGATDGGTISSTVAAGIDCLDLILESVAGRRRLGVVRRHIGILTASLFNIILHLQGPAIFYRKLTNEADMNPDEGSVVLMCVEVLTRISRKHALFQMDPGHIGQSLRIPAALFQDFHHLRLCKTSHLSESLRFTERKNCEHLTSSLVVDKKFSVELYAACCRLLYTFLKHHKSKCVQCISLLQNSVQALLYCLEMVDVDSADKDYFTWEVQEGIKCAGHLRRIYEEIRQQKDVYGQHCFLFLSNYIWLYSGYGPLRRGIKREIDEALRPGVYALVDVCSSDDLQHLHTVFGEGPCRSTLASLRRDYKLNFQYEGKV